MSPAPSLQRQRQQQQQDQQQQHHQVKFNPESRVIYYDDYDTMTEDEDDYELVFNDPMPSQQTGTYSYSFKHDEEEEEAEERMKKLALMNGRDIVSGEGNGDNGGGRGFKTISPPTYGEDGIREVPMDREIPIQRPSGENNRARNNNNNNHGDEEEEDDVASEASPNASPTRQLGKGDHVDENGVSSTSSSATSSVSVSVSVKETPQKIGTQARRLVSPVPMHEP